MSSDAVIVKESGVAVEQNVPVHLVTDASLSEPLIQTPRANIKLPPMGKLKGVLEKLCALSSVVTVAISNEEATLSLSIESAVCRVNCVFSNLFVPQLGIQVLFTMDPSTDTASLMSECSR